ncbi:MAG: DNA modification methylase [Sediminibacterium sp.]
MKQKTTGEKIQTYETVEQVSTTSLKLNTFKENLYKVDKAFDSLKLSIEHNGIKEPLIVEKDTNMIISGNRRLKVAMQLGLKDVPVIFRDINGEDKEKLSVIHENQREKTYSQYLAEYKILQKKYPLSQGARTDLREKEALYAEALKKFTKLSRTTLFYLTEIEEMASAKYKKGKESQSYKTIWNDLDEGYKTPKYWYDKLKPSSNDKLDMSMNQKYDLDLKSCQIINHTCEDVSGVKENSVSCFLSSPPYWGYERKYGNKEQMLGREKDADDYLKRLVEIYKNSLSKLKKGGSIWVNLNDVCTQGEYNIIPHRFVLMMLNIGLVLNDEIVWAKKNPTPISGNHIVRGFEYIFHFVRKTDKKNFFYNKNFLTGANALKLKVAEEGGEFEERNLNSALDFKDGILLTSSPNIEKLRRACKIKGIKCDHDATFPIDVAILPIILTTKEGDIIMDHFAGTGTVGLVAGALGRKSILYEQNPEYCKVAEMRLTELVSQWESLDFIESENSVNTTHLKQAA